MLRKFEVTNYKNFKDTLTIDFSAVGGYQFNSDCINNETISKMLAYGRNSTGKTNLGSAIIDITMSRFLIQRGNRNNFLNADSDCDYATFNYVFQFDDNHVQYLYRKKALGAFVYEKLIINDDVIFEFDYRDNAFLFDQLTLISAETIIVDRFLESIADDNPLDETIPAHPSFLRWLLANAAFGSDSIMIKLRNYIDRMAYYSVYTMSRNQPVPNDEFIQSLEGEELKNLEKFLNAMGVECELENKRLPDGQNEIYFKHKVPVPFFRTASSGTLVLFNLYRRIATRIKQLSFFYLDEFDAFFHYEMSEKFLKYVKENFPHCQVILTTHNTNLMTNRIMRPDCVVILTHDGKITALNKATTRELREGHNLEKLYMSGEFDG